MVTTGRITSVDPQKYLVDVITSDGRVFKNVQVPFIAGVDGFYGLSVVPSVGQRCLLFNTDYGLAALPVFVIGNSKIGFNPTRQFDDGTAHIARKENPVEGEFFLSLPETIVDVLPDGRFYLYLGDFKEKLTSLEMEPTYTKLRTGSFMLVTAGSKFVHNFDEDTREAETSYHFQRFAEGGFQVDVSLSDSMKIDVKETENILTALLETNHTSLTVPGFTLETTQKEVKAELSPTELTCDSVKLKVKETLLEGQSIRIELPQGTVEIDSEGVSVQLGGTTFSLTQDGLEIRAKKLSINAREIEMTGNVSVSGNVTIDQTLSVGRDVNAQGTVRSKGEPVVRLSEGQRAFDDVSSALSNFAVLYSGHIHPASMGPTGTPLGGTPRVPTPRLRG